MSFRTGLRIIVGSFSHATEDEEKVKKAMINLISFDPGRPTIKKLLGHWRNPIINIEYELHGKDAELFLRNLSSKLKEIDKEFLINILDERTDEKGRVHLRFDKQKAFLGEISLSDFDDIIKVVISFSGNKKELKNIIKNLLYEKVH